MNYISNFLTRQKLFQLIHINSSKRFKSIICYRQINCRVDELELLILIQYGAQNQQLLVYYMLQLSYWTPQNSLIYIYRFSVRDEMSELNQVIHIYQNKLRIENQTIIYEYQMESFNISFKIMQMEREVILQKQVNFLHLLAISMGLIENYFWIYQVH
ncbi:unnamed protein product [Paramecium sonneborni]|uniref:Transmembrane protein n=1 Tax=Paramecium sonneborni TaxID=65129 RepID=A0A8S1PMH9_9CILI|nr:unnamed protein product [Paramecium sonneborni]